MARPPPSRQPRPARERERPSQATRRRLRELNRDFYARVADEFDASRSHPWPGWERLLGEFVAEPSSQPLRVLDLGCGNGRFGAWLAACAQRPVEYLGVDENPTLLAAAGAACAPLAASALSRLDLLEDERGRTIPRGPFDLVVLFGLLHHVPGFEARAQLLRSALERLSPCGRLAVSLWRFADHERFRRRTLEDDAVRKIGIDPTDLERGDALLRFGQKSAAVRYCHHFDTVEAARLLSALPARCLREIDSDGREGKLNHYWLLESRPEGGES